jgi:hypothetical protein
MGIHARTLAALTDELLSGEQAQMLARVLDTAVEGDSNPDQPPTPRIDVALLFAFDDELPGPSVYRLRESAYAVEDRDVFRPLQYVDMEFCSGARHGDLAWRSRDIVEMASLHIEALVKRVGRVWRLPLGQALREQVVRQRVDAVTHGRIRRFVRIYNDAKHVMNHPAGTHLFTIGEAVRAYAACRVLAVPLYPLAGLASRPYVWQDDSQAPPGVGPDGKRSSSA